MEIRPEAPGDIAAIHALVAACFPSDAEGRLIDAPRAAGRLSLSLVAIEDGQVVGHIGFSPMTGLAGGLGLAPLAVQIDHRRRGIGAQLAREGLAACSRLGGAIRHGVGLIRYAPESAAL